MSSTAWSGAPDSSRNLSPATLEVNSRPQGLMISDTPALARSRLRQPGGTASSGGLTVGVVMLEESLEEMYEMSEMFEMLESSKEELVEILEMLESLKELQEEENL